MEQCVVALSGRSFQRMLTYDVLENDCLPGVLPFSIGLSDLQSAPQVSHSHHPFVAEPFSFSSKALRYPAPLQDKQHANTCFTLSTIAQANDTWRTMTVS